MQTDIRHAGCHVGFKDRYPYAKTFFIALHDVVETEWGTNWKSDSNWVSIWAKNDEGVVLDITLFGEQAVREFESLADDRIDKISNLADQMQDLAFQQRGEHEQRGTAAGDELAEVFNEFLTAFEQINLFCDGEVTDESV